MNQFDNNRLQESDYSIIEVDTERCNRCGICVDMCPMDVYRRRNGKVYIAYQDDCCNCMACLNICAVDAVVFAPGAPKKFSRIYRWELVKEALKTT